MAEKKKNGAAGGGPPKFSKRQLLGFQQYRGRADLLQVLLNETKKYTAAEVDAAIEQFMKGKVN